MRLKAIEMQGFKSFPDKTRISFDSGVTAIIGPNGSGKSNISDAIRWVLGEMSAKSLRGSKMEDVIFNGTASRSAANSASVSLIIDTEEEYNRANAITIEVEENSEDNNQNAGYRLSDNVEVTVTRKLYRSGESEYYINKKQVRLKDIYELFYDTGIGREGYSVIGQGKIAEVLSQKDDERRSIFEEAAGISKIRYKKLEAERKLRDTENNLVRVNDILSEISSRIGPLEKEAENAKQYLVLSEEKKGIEITLWLDRLDYLRARRVECEEEFNSAKTAFAAAEKAVSECDAATDRILNESYEFSRVMSECEHEKTDAVTKKGEAEGRKAVCANDIAHAEESVAESKGSISASVSEKEIAIEQTKNCEKAKAEFQEKLALAETNTSEAEKAYESARNAYNETDKQSLGNQAALELLLAEQSALNARAAACNASLDAEKRTADENSGRLNDAKDRMSLLQTEMAEVEAKLLEVAKLINDTENNIVSLDYERASLLQALRKTNEEITEEKIAMSGEEQKREQLTRLENLLEGYSESVKRVINDCTSGKIKNNGADIQLHGTVSNIISSESEYVIALETALAASVQFIVVEKESDAKACIRYLKENKLGRATFLPIESVTGRLADVSAIKDMDGYIGIASELAKFDKKFQGVVDDLLGRTVIADNIDSASAIARKSGFRIKIVTLDGQIINAGGSYTGGSSAVKVGVFTRAMDIERLGEQIKEREKKIASLEERCEKLNSDCSEADEKLENLRITLSRCNNEKAGHTATKESLTVRINEEQERIDSLSSGRELLSKLESELATIKSESENLADAILKATTSRDELRLKADSLKSEEEKAFALVNDARMALFTAKNELAVAGERLELAKRREIELDARITLGNTSLEKAKAIIDERMAETEKLNLVCAECDKIIANCDKKLAELMAGRDAKEKELVEMRNKQKTVAGEKEDAFRRVTEAEMKSTSVNNEFDSVTGKLWDEYELTYSDAESFRLPKEKMDKAPSRLASLKSKIRAMGVINVNAVEDYRVTKERFDFLTAQTDDLNKTRASLDRTIAKLASGMKETFLECFEKINTEFNAVFTELFGGGSARCELTDPLLPLECGIDIVLKVPGKSVRSISLLSGGEQSFAAISLYLALQKVNPSPFCVFDEIESALDDVNIVKLASYVRRNSDKTQYILITHRRGTMERADTIYGITMRQRGISEYMKLNMAKLDDIIKEYAE
ncbi:MAG: chromosome segregation protein SMC [Ruminococcaceae bacterium]|nr:chromosome segregation protein SMC [Oscillospiraceae bacterium]